MSGSKESRLRPVGDDERAAEPMSVDVAARHGSKRDLLVAMRDRVAETVADPQCAARDLAALTKRLAEIVRDIEAVDAVPESESRIRDLEKALRQLSPDHVLLKRAVDDKFDVSAI